MRLLGLRLPLLVFGLLLIPLSLSIASCGDNEEEGKGASGSATAVTPKSSPIDISKVPELQDREMLIGSDIAYAPVEFYKEGTQQEQGMDVDLVNAMAQRLGVTAKFQQVAEFAGIVQDLKSKRYDIVMSAISITDERSAEIDFVPYFGPVGTGILVPKGNPKNIKAITDICGLNIAAQTGTFQVDQMNTLNEGDCKDKKINIQTFPDNPSAVQEVGLGRVDAELADDPVAAYSAVQSGGGLVELVVTGFEAAPYGIGVRKDSGPLKSALEDALQQIMNDGTYTDILKKWDQEQFALKP